VRFNQCVAVGLGGICLWATVATAKDVFVYPQKGQSAEHQQKDEFECYAWAKGQTGFDPMAQPTASSPPPPHGDTGVGAVGGAARGAAGGAIIGAIAGDAGKGAAIGAVGGGMMGGMRRRDRQRQQQSEQQQWEQQQMAQYQQQRSQYNRAYSACLEGRGYSVN
jgi:hypothetical protein